MEAEFAGIVGDEELVAGGGSLGIEEVFFFEEGAGFFCAGSGGVDEKDVGADLLLDGCSKEGVMGAAEEDPLDAALLERAESLLDDECAHGMFDVALFNKGDEEWAGEGEELEG